MKVWNSSNIFSNYIVLSIQRTKIKFVIQNFGYQDFLYDSVLIWIFFKKQKFRFKYFLTPIIKKAQNQKSISGLITTINQKGLKDTTSSSNISLHRKWQITPFVEYKYVRPRATPIMTFSRVAHESGSSANLIGIFDNYFKEVIKMLV